MSAPHWREEFARALHTRFHADTIAGKSGEPADEAWEHGRQTDDDEYWREQADAILAAIAGRGYRLHRDHDWAPAPEYDPMIVSQCKRCAALCPGLRDSASCEGQP